MSVKKYEIFSFTNFSKISKHPSKLPLQLGISVSLCVLDWLISCCILKIPSPLETISYREKPGSEWVNPYAAGG